MYYHCRKLKYVEYGKVNPPPENTILEEFINPYKWLSHYCGGFCPQIWLSRSHSSITGFRGNVMLKKRKWVRQTREEVKDSMDNVLFGFDVICGYPVSFNHWELLLFTLINCPNDFNDQNKQIVKYLNDLEKDYIEEKIPLDGEIKDWVNSNRNLDVFLNKYVFKEIDQVVVSSLNLKVAKKIICRDERQKRALRKMGFIEDRIIIKNIKRNNF
jgi:hypothetical protein